MSIPCTIWVRSRWSLHAVTVLGGKCGAGQRWSGVGKMGTQVCWGSRGFVTRQSWERAVTWAAVWVGRVALLAEGFGGQRWAGVLGGFLSAPFFCLYLYHAAVYSPLLWFLEFFLWFHQHALCVLLVVAAGATSVDLSQKFDITPKLLISLLIWQSECKLCRFVFYFVFWFKNEYTSRLCWNW